MQQVSRRDWLRMMVGAGLMSALPKGLGATTFSRYTGTDVRVPIAPYNPAIIFDEGKCVYCGACKSVCRRMMSVDGFFDLAKTGDVPVCVHCGQCVTVCEGDAIQIRPEWQAVKAAKAAGKTVVVSLSPAVRVAVSEAFGQPAGAFCEGEVIAALRALGADYVLDTCVGADITILEEAKEFVGRLQKGDGSLPIMSSCCPAWVQFCETYFPDLLSHLSTAKSPIGMQGVAIKTFFAREKGIDPEKIFNVALTPCPAKKFEIRRPEFGVGWMRGMDAVVTVQELANWMRAECLDYQGLVPSQYDSLLGEASGAGVIFGNTGGVTEAILRSAYFFYTGKQPPKEFLNFTAVRGLLGTETRKPGMLKIATATFSETCSVTVLVAQGLANARKVMNQLREGTLKADFIEVMACEGGCIGGAGLPRASDAPYLTREMRQARLEALQVRGDSAKQCASHENPAVKAFYDAMLGEVGSPKAKQLCHTSYTSRAAALGK
jgi:ferredoxin hydrogenase